jgi:hypothetical protein
VSSLGYENTYFVKISDDVPTETQLIGGIVYESSGWRGMIYEENIDTSAFPGAIQLFTGDAVIVYDADTLNGALGLPSGHVTNGTYFVRNPDESYANRLVTSSIITKISSEHLDVDGAIEDAWYRLDIPTHTIRYDATQSLTSREQQIARSNIDVYSKSEVDTKIANGGNIDLSGYAKTSEVQSLITSAITGAIGGSY